MLALLLLPLLPLLLLAFIAHFCLHGSGHSATIFSDLCVVEKSFGSRGGLLAKASL
jgi:hypothetical protein